MSSFLTNKKCDLVLSSLALTSYCARWDIAYAPLTPFFRGLQFFSLAALVDHTLRSLLVPESKKEKISFTKSCGSALIEEALYSGILLTQSWGWMIPRFGAALITSMTAARALVGKVQPQQPGFSLDTKIGFGWALARESLLLTLPYFYSLPLFIVLDSVIFALAEVAPTQKASSFSLGSKPWLYKSLSSLFFRILANSAALRYGISSSLTQHLFFNISHALS